MSLIFPVAANSKMENFCQFAADAGCGGLKLNKVFCGEPDVSCGGKKNVQQRLIKQESVLKKPYSLGPYNRIKGKKQAIRLTEGCIWNCPNCHEPTEIRLFPLPKIERNEVLIFDMNLACKPQSLQIIRDLGNITVNNKHVRYELVCGVDYRFMSPQLAEALYKSRFGYVGFDSKLHKKRIIRMAWDGKYSEQKKIKKAIDMLIKAGYKSKEIMLFMQANYRLSSYEECLKKLDLCKVWRVKVCDCYYDGQIGKHIQPVFWSAEEIQSFRAKVRKHNQLVNFGIDPECKEEGF